ncbi:NAD-dependent epimerase/dehydratase family protein [Oxalobacteraceae bacterium]|nr:NAD-dependent epimerase/dehydratase family protein [Oxalobacteraceae bacterium]
MNRLAILGASSQIAKDLIRSIAAASSYELLLYVRDSAAEGLRGWLAQAGLAGRFPVLAYEAYGAAEHDAVLNFVGVGDPSRAAAMGGDIFDITLQYDQLALDYVKRHPRTRYLFLSSGAAYGNTFLEPAGPDTRSSIGFNALTPQEYYSVAKLHAECRHRALPALAIVDLRVFNYFSRSQDMGARFFITDIVRAIQAGTVLQTSPDHMVRDFLHPNDFYQLVHSVLQAPAQNAVFDCYSRAPVEKPALLAAMAERFGLRYEIVAGLAAPVNATGTKPHYYSLNRQAGATGYAPAYSSLDTVLTEAAAILDGAAK